MPDCVPVRLMDASVQRPAKTMSAKSFTTSQQAALTARGNVLVVAGAGTGKTHTLVERCCSLLLEENCSLDEILMVTFTEAAAAEMRKRIRARLMERQS